MEQKKPNPVHVYQASYLLAAIVRRIRAKQKAAKEREKITQQEDTPPEYLYSRQSPLRK